MLAIKIQIISCQICKGRLIHHSTNIHRKIRYLQAALNSNITTTETMNWIKYNDTQSFSELIVFGKTNCFEVWEVLPIYRYTVFPDVFKPPCSQRKIDKGVRLGSIHITVTLYIFLQSNFQCAVSESARRELKQTCCSTFSYVIPSVYFWKLDPSLLFEVSILRRLTLTIALYWTFSAHLAPKP